MIEEIAICGLGVIESAEIRPGSGFTALTGETGAGKTMILTAVALLMGSKAPTGLVRGEKARVEGRIGSNRDLRFISDVPFLGLARAAGPSAAFARLDCSMSGSSASLPRIHPSDKGDFSALSSPIGHGVSQPP